MRIQPGPLNIEQAKEIESLIRLANGTGHNTLCSGGIVWRIRKGGSSGGLRYSHTTCNKGKTYGFIRCNKATAAAVLESLSDIATSLHIG